MIRPCPILSFALLLTAAGTVSAQKAYVRDVAHSQINFVAESKLVDAHGTFDRWDAGDPDPVRHRVRGEEVAGGHRASRVRAVGPSRAVPG